MKQISNESQHIEDSLLTGMKSGTKINSKCPQQQAQNNIQSICGFKNKVITKPIGMHNFNSNKADNLSLQESVDEVVSSFVEYNKDNIIKYVADEVHNKLNEKIGPLNFEINNNQKNFNSLYNEEIKNFKELDILNDFHNNILNINNKVSIINENTNKYFEGIKGFNITDNKLNFLNKLNKNLEDFINEVNQEISKNMDMDIEEDDYINDVEKKKKNNVSQELNNIFNETLSLLNNINAEDVSIFNNSEFQSSILNISNNIKNTIDDFGNKFNFKRPFFEEKNKSDKVGEEIITKNNKNKFLENIPNFFDLN